MGTSHERASLYIGDQNILEFDKLFFLIASMVVFTEFVKTIDENKRENIHMRYGIWHKSTRMGEILNPCHNFLNF